MNNSAGSAFFSDNESFTSFFTDISEQDEVNFAGGGGGSGKSGKKSGKKSGGSCGCGGYC